MGGLSGGPTLLQILQSWAGQRLGTEVGPEDLAVAHAQAIRDAYAWRLAHMGHASTPQAGCTSHVSVVDARGRMVSLTNTLLARFGAKVVLPQTGFLMNNGMMWFDPRPGRPNSLAAGARPLANMCPVVVTRAGEPWLALGAAGGRTIVPAVAQLLSFLIDRGCTLEQAFNHSRVEASTSSVIVSDQAPASVVSALRARFATEVVADTVYPVQFAVPSAVMADAGLHTGMAHPLHPWAGVARGDAGGAAT
jgi:gamma-glutamyltranspeptidase/glutathione hydrolase